MASLITTLGDTIAAVCSRCQSQRNYEFAMDRLTTARYFTPLGRSIQAKGISPDIEALQDVPEDLKARAADIGGEASLRGHLKAQGVEEPGSQSYIPPDPKDDKALHAALDLMRGVAKNPAFTPMPKA